MKRKPEITSPMKPKKQPQFEYYGTLFDHLEEQMETSETEGPTPIEEKQETVTSKDEPA